MWNRPLLLKTVGAHGLQPNNENKASPKLIKSCRSRQKIKKITEMSTQKSVK